MKIRWTRDCEILLNYRYDIQLEEDTVTTVKKGDIVEADCFGDVYSIGGIRFVSFIMNNKYRTGAIDPEWYEVLDMDKLIKENQELILKLENVEKAIPDTFKFSGDTPVDSVTRMAKNALGYNCERRVLIADIKVLEENIEKATAEMPEGYRIAKDTLQERVALLVDGLRAYSMERMELLAEIVALEAKVEQLEYEILDTRNKLDDKYKGPSKEPYKSRTLRISLGHPDPKQNE